MQVELYLFDSNEYQILVQGAKLFDWEILDK